MTIDWERATQEAASLLREYLRIDTSNPPGNEAQATAFLSSILEGDGIACEIAESAPGRANLRARIGPPGLDSVCLLSHTDVVPVERRFWDVDPFAGELRDGMIWGRGALDMKGMGIIELMVFRAIRQEGIALRRGLSLLAVADEEAGSTFGMGWIEEHRPDWLDASLVINEGAYGLSGMNPRKTQIFQVAPTEKVPVWVRLTARGRPGHGSVPHGDNCADRLVSALGRVAAWQQKVRVTPIMRAHADGLTKAGVLRDGRDSTLIQLAAASPAVRARLANTVVLTSLQAGIKVNVIPAEATATLDCRLLPDVDVDRFIGELTGIISDARIAIEVLNRAMGAASPLDHDFVRVVEETVAAMVEGSRVVPEMTPGFTDSRYYRLRGVPAYGFVPCLVPPEELGGIHGHNERISVDNLRLGMQVLYEVVRRLCA